MSDLILTPDQQAAYEGFAQFITDPTQDVFILKGYSGTGKTTLVRYLINQLPKLFKMNELLDPDFEPWDMELRATTHKAAENFADLSGHPTGTIHSLLGLRVQQDFRNNTTKLIPKDQNFMLYDTLVWIDEASYMDRELLHYLFKHTQGCKIVLIGDDAQLLSVGSNVAHAFNLDVTTAELTKVVRTESDPILELSTLFRHTVKTGEWPQFTPDGQAIQHLSREDFEAALLQEFADPAWTYKRSKVLAYRNKTVIAYNHGIREHVAGQAHIEVGDYVVNNKYIYSNRVSFNTDQIVQVTGISDNTVQFDVAGRLYEINKQIWLFMPYSAQDKADRLKLARKEKNFGTVATISETWIDLRAAYAQTINKAQGSTYDRVFIDLDDLKVCRNPNQLARMLYVAISRARHQVIFTGDLV